jgi:hypothetical protein
MSEPLSIYVSDIALLKSIVHSIFRGETAWWVIHTFRGGQRHQGAEEEEQETEAHHDGDI